MRLFTVLLLLWLSHAAKAELNHAIVVNTFTHHIIVYEGQDLNQDNYGIGYQNDRFEIGTLTNSRGGDSWYIGSRTRYSENLSLNVGYIDHPDFSAYASITYDAGLFQLGVAPNVLFLQLKFGFKL